MAHERVYSPENSEPFDVTPSRAQKLVLNEGWTRTPWTRQPVEAPVEPIVLEDEAAEEPAEYAARTGRGRRRRAAEAAPAVEAEDDSADHGRWRH